MTRTEELEMASHLMKMALDAELKGAKQIPGSATHGFYVGLATAYNNVADELVNRAE